MKHLWLQVASIFILTTTSCYGSDIGSFNDSISEADSELAEQYAGVNGSLYGSDTESDSGFISEGAIQLQQDSLDTKPSTSRKYSQVSDHTDSSTSTICPQTSPITPQRKAAEATALHEKIITPQHKTPAAFPMSPLEKNSRKIFTALTHTFIGDPYTENSKKKTK